MAHNNDPLAASIALPRAEREQLRWFILLCLWHARPYGANERLIHGATADARLRATTEMVRQEMQSLAQRGLISITRDGPLWGAQLSAQGEDVVDYRAPAPAGVARPQQW